MDRNVPYPIPKLCNVLSLSARRAWIEISIHKPSIIHDVVALRKGSVDRNELFCALFFVYARRSPQGERG